MNFLTRAITFIIFLTASIYSQEDTFTIADGVLVETTGGTYIQLAGDLVEASTGYLKGKVTSGVRTGVTSFAGLTIGSGMDGTITRNTGSEYSKLKGEGKNLLRYYELNNTGGAITPTNMGVNYVNSGPRNEQNGLSGPYFIYAYDNTDWAAFGSGATSSPVADNSVGIGAGATDIVLSEGIKINSKVYLEGPYDATANAMTTTINADISLTSPYPDDVRLALSVPSDAVDWVLVEIRDTPSGLPIAYRSCFLKSDGRLMADDASNDIGLPWIPGSYYVVIRHRNHLGIMSPATIPAEFTNLTWGGSPSTYDFSSAQTQAYTTGPNPMVLIDTTPSNVYGAYSADANSDGSINATDYNTYWLPDNGTAWNYNKYSDFNLDGSINATDYNTHWLPNNGTATQIP